MGRERKYEKDKQSGFAREHRKVPGVYMTDVDGIVWTTSNTENTAYVEYGFVGNNKSRIRKIVEYKYDLTDYIKRLIKGEEKPNPQLIALVHLVSGYNVAMSLEGADPAEVWYVVATENELPFHCFTVDQNFEFDFKGTVKTEEEYRDMFNN